jgi:type IV secretion system protein VirD4
MSIVAIIQSFAQLQKNYGKEGCEIITDNTQLTIFGGFAPNSGSAEVLSKALGNRTVQSGSVSRGKNDPSQSLQMIERALLTPDELKSLPKGAFVVMKTGFYPMRVRLKLFFKWGIVFPDKVYTVPDKGNRRVSYASQDILEQEIVKIYSTDSRSAGDKLTPEELDDRREKYPPEQKTIRKQAQEKHRDKVKNKSKPRGGGQAISDSNLTAKERKEIIFDSEGVIYDASVVGRI